MPDPTTLDAAAIAELIARYESAASMLEGCAAAEARHIARALRDSVRLDALRPFLRVGETDGEEWGLWCIAPSQEDREDIHAIYSRDADEKEEATRDAHREHWGPNLDAMLDELAASRPAAGGTDAEA